MAATLACRGPDASGIWLGRHAGLAHQRLSIIDLEGGRQPMVGHRGRQDLPVVLSYSGEVYNFRELRAELSNHGHKFRTHSDTEVVLHAYLQWGAAFAERLNGMFAFAIWDEQLQKLLLIRDRLGIKPLYFAPLNDGVLFGSEPKSVLAHPRMTAGLDQQGLADMLGLIKSPGCTPFQGIEEVPPGSFATLDHRGLQVHRYWKLERTPHEDNAEETTHAVRELLADTVERQMVSDVPLCSLLSGGLDSSILTALATSTEAKRSGRAVRSFAVDFVGSEADFKSSEFRPERDTPYALEVARSLGTDHRVIELSAAELTDDAARRSVLRAHDLPLTFGDVDTSLHLLFRSVRQQSTVALSGESADEVFGGYLWFQDPSVIEGAEFPWLSRMQLMTPDLFTPEFRAATSFQEYRADSYSQAISAVEHLPEDGALERRMREICHLNLTRWLPTLLDRKDRLSMAAGLEVRVPFCDHRLVEYVYNTPWHLKAPNGEPKGLLKQAAAGLVPDSVIRRKKSPYPTTGNELYEKDLRHRTRELLGRPSSPAFDVVHAKGLADLLDRPEGWFDSQLRRNNLETALFLDEWMRTYHLSPQ